MDENNRGGFEPNTGEQNRDQYQPQNGYDPQPNQYQPQSGYGSQQYGQPNGQPQYQQPQYGQQYNNQQQYQQPQYNQQYSQQNQYPYGYVPAPVVPGKSKATAALVMGIISIVISWTGIVSLCIGSIIGAALGIAALVLGINAKKVMPPNQNGVAIGGIICGAIGLVLSIIFTVYSIWLYAFIFSIAEHYGNYYYDFWD